jgi:3-hydroxybutyryl-CoA dehydrogenase
VEQHTILLVGRDTLTYSLAVCLLKAGHAVILKTEGKKEALDYLASIGNAYLSEDSTGGFSSENLSIVTNDDFPQNIALAIAVTGEDAAVKKALIHDLEAHVSSDVTIVINTESVLLSELQKEALVPSRILGVNWVEPVHSTFFMEIIANSVTDPSRAEYVKSIATEHWNKDPYLIQGESGIRAQLLAALIREAFYLVTNDYATVEDVDRACRNDAGYYMSFAGNLRYMDLMGTYAYGMVMEDLNRELTKDTQVPAFFSSMITNGEHGMHSGKGFYDYKPGEAQKWGSLLNQFGQQVNVLIDKYPFKYKTEEVGLR